MVIVWPCALSFAQRLATSLTREDEAWNLILDIFPERYPSRMERWFQAPLQRIPHCGCGKDPAASMGNRFWIKRQDESWYCIVTKDPLPPTLLIFLAVYHAILWASSTQLSLCSPGTYIRSTILCLSLTSLQFMCSTVLLGLTAYRIHYTRNTAGDILANRSYYYGKILAWCLRKLRTYIFRLFYQIVSSLNF